MCRYQQARVRFNVPLTYEKIGNVQKAQGHLPEALASYQVSLAIDERLAQSDPGNAGWQRDLIVSYVKMAEIDRSQARGMLMRAAEIANNMQSKGLLAPSDAWMPGDLARRIAELPK